MTNPLKTRVVILVTAMFCALAGAQEMPSILEDPAAQTVSSPNGKAWKLLPASEKLAFLAGFIAGNTCRGDDPQFRLNTGRTKLDHFYANPENLIIPINTAVLLLAGEARNSYFDSDVAVTRKFYKDLDLSERLKGTTVEKQ